MDVVGTTESEAKVAERKKWANLRNKGIGGKSHGLWDSASTHAIGNSAKGSGKKKEKWVILKRSLK